MKIKTLATGSTGNAYLVEDGGTVLLLECGIPKRELMRRSGYRLSEVDACLITHEHGDHARAVRDVMALGIPVWCSKGTAVALGIDGDTMARPIMTPELVFRIGSMIITPIALEHDAAEPLGWLIYSEVSNQRLVFITDTKSADIMLPAVHHIMVECNHTGLAGMLQTNAYHAERVVRSHMSLDDCIRFLRHQNLSQVQDIYLIHISSSHGDPEAMQRAVAAATGRQVIIARPEK